VPPKEYDVTIPLPPGSEGLSRQLFGEKAGNKFAKIAAGTADGTLQWKLKLLRGTYSLVLADGAVKVVTVKGRGVIDVTDPA
jgi:hypothetical protein